MNDSTKLLIYLNQTVDFFCYICYMTCIDLTRGDFPWYSKLGVSTSFVCRFCPMITLQETFQELQITN